MNEPIFFDGFEDLLRVAVTAPVMYAAIILFVRLSGKRSTSQMNNFDWIVTVALGSLMGSCILLKNVTILEGILAIGALMALQWLLTRSVIRNRMLEKAVKAQPTLLVHEGQLLHEAMRDQRITRDEILAAVRSSGHASIEDVRWVILETDANFSVIPRSGNMSAIDDLVGVRTPS